jgi:nicotinamide mononucleotide transporter
MALMDAILTSGGMVATWMLTQKFIEQWIFWIIINVLSFAVMIYKGLYPSAFLFAVYELMAIKGYFEWKKVLK